MKSKRFRIFAANQKLCGIPDTEATRRIKHDLHVFPAKRQNMAL